VSASSKVRPPGARRARIEDLCFHDLRHTWASWHVQSGTSLPEMTELGGWKSYEMVLRYAHLAPEKLSSVAGRIERQALRLVEVAQRGANVAENATFRELRRARLRLSS
jgi:integrase